MSLGSKYDYIVNKKLFALSMRLNEQRHVCAVRDAFIMTFPIMLMGSFVSLLNFAILDDDGFVAKMLFFYNIVPNLSDYQDVLFPVLRGSTNIISIMIVFLIAKNVAMRTKSDEMMSGLTALSVYFMIYPRYITINDFEYMTTRCHGTQGIFVSLIIGLVVGELFSRLSKLKMLSVNTPAQVPNNVSCAFKSLLPVIIINVIFALVSYFLNSIYPDGVYTIIHTEIVRIFQHLGTNLMSLILFTIILNLLWFLGIHGHQVLGTVHSVMFSEALAENTRYVAQHDTAWGAPNLTVGLLNAFSSIGGSGMTFALIISIFIVSKRKEDKDIAKWSLLPSIFNINEPIIFALPIVLNPLFIIPFILAPVVNILIGYLAVVTGIIPPLAYDVPWSTPGLFIAFLATGGGPLATLVSFLCLGVSIIIYAPFVILANKVAAEAGRN